MLTKFGRTPTSADTLGRQFADFLDVIAVSDKHNKVVRLFDICFSVVKNRRVDYVIIDTYSTSAFYFAFFSALLCQLFNVKYIPILRGGSLPARLSNSPKMSAIVFNHSFVNVSPSEYLRYEFLICGYNNVVTIPNNIPINEYSFKERHNLKPNLLWVRSFSKIYNCTMAVEVLNIMLKKFPDAKLCMVGPDKDGSMNETIGLAKKYGIADHLTVTGCLTKHDWHELSENYDIFISTTDFDNTPVSVIEAMALGLTVVSTNVGGVPYLINDGFDGLLVGRGDYRMMADKIESLLSNSELNHKLSVNARKKAESFDWNVVKNQWKTILK